MRVLGKRPVYLLALLVFIAANAWSNRAQSWGSLLGGRMLSGFASAAADATVPSVVADLFFLSHRGKCMMFFHIALASGVFLGPIANAYVVQLHTWRWSPAWIAIAGGIIFVLAFLFIRETEYRDRQQLSEDRIPCKRTYADWLSLNIGYNREKPAKRFFRTLGDIMWLALYPPIIWAGCLVGVFTGIVIIIQVRTHALVRRELR